MCLTIKLMERCMGLEELAGLCNNLAAENKVELLKGEIRRLWMCRCIVFLMRGLWSCVLPEVSG